MKMSRLRFAVKNTQNTIVFEIYFIVYKQQQLYIQFCEIFTEIVHNFVYKISFAF